MSGCTTNLARVEAVPATLTAEHWNQALSLGSALSMISEDRPWSTSILQKFKNTCYEISTSSMILLYAKAFFVSST